MRPRTRLGIEEGKNARRTDGSILNKSATCTIYTAEKQRGSQRESLGSDGFVDEVASELWKHLGKGAANAKSSSILLPEPPTPTSPTGAT